MKLDIIAKEFFVISFVFLSYEILEIFSVSLNENIPATIECIHLLGIFPFREKSICIPAREMKKDNINNNV